MRILIDESLPRHLKRMLSEHEPSTVQEMGWTGIRNSELLEKAETAFDVLLTADKNLRYQRLIPLAQFGLSKSNSPTEAGIKGICGLWNRPR